METKRRNSEVIIREALQISQECLDNESADLGPVEFAIKKLILQTHKLLTKDMGELRLTYWNFL